MIKGGRVQKYSPPFGVKHHLGMLEKSNARFIYNNLL